MVYRQLGDVVFFYKKHISGIPTQWGYGFQGKLYVVYKHAVAIGSPQRRQIAKVSTKLLGSMRHSDVRLVKCQGYVMFWIKYV